MIDQNQKELLKTRLKDYAERNLDKARHGGYICPNCRNGSGADGTGIEIKDGATKWKCWVCGEQGDIFDLIGLTEGIDNLNEQYERACSIFYLKADTARSITPKEPQPEPDEPETDFTEYFRECAKHIGETDYLTNRGIPKELIDRFNIGYDEFWTHPKKPYDTPTARVIIPISRNSYVARAVKDGAQGTKQKVKGKSNPTWIFNRIALKTAKAPIFVVEGEIDALSIIAVGGEAIAIGSIAYVRQFLEQVDRYKPKQPLIIAFDNDPLKEGETETPAQKATKKLAHELRQRGIVYYTPDVKKFYGVGADGKENKDSNDSLRTDKAGFTERVKGAIERMQDLEPVVKATDEVIVSDSVAVKPEPTPETPKDDKTKPKSARDRMGAFIHNCTDPNVDTLCTPTGFEILDGILDGGLYEGLYTIGAISSLGKTTFVMQIADQIAQQGRDVLIFSLEMAATELMSKSISRHTAEISEKKGHSTDWAKTPRQITSSRRYRDYSADETITIGEAVEAYNKYADHIYISEGVGNIGVQEVTERVREHITLTGNKPVVVIDYLQILAPVDMRATDKQNTDRAVLELKRTSRDLKIPVFIVSSFNRASYTDPVSMSSFKESGAVEYSSDVLIGLQYEGMDYKIVETWDKDLEKQVLKSETPTVRDGRIRALLDNLYEQETVRVQLKMLKNRFGKKGESVIYEYTPMFNRFVEKEKMAKDIKRRNREPAETTTQPTGRRKRN